MKNFKNTIIFLSLLLILQTANFSKFSDYIEFNPLGYTVKSRQITLGGTILNTQIDSKLSHISIDLKKNGETYKLQMLNFDSIVKLMDFWYTFVNDYSDTLNSAISAVPFVYGSFNSMYQDLILMSWFNGFNKTFYLILATDKAGADDLKYRINNFKINGD